MNNGQFSLVRAYLPASNSYVTDGMLTLDNRFLVMRPNSLPLPLDGVVIEFFTGKVAESGQPIYQNDEVECATPNEFGSVLIETGVVRYDAATMCYKIVSHTATGDYVAPTQILRVLGQNHEG